MKKAIFIILFLLLAIPSVAQLKIPTGDIGLKTGFTTDSNYDLLMVDIRGEANVHIIQYVSIGFFYSRSVFGEYINQSADLDLATDQLVYGGKLQASLGRIPKFRPYVFLSYSKLEMVQELEASRLAFETSGISFGAGLMLKLNDRLYMNLIEFEFRPINDEIFFYNDPIEVDQLAIRFGANYTIGKLR